MNKNTEENIWGSREEEKTGKKKPMASDVWCKKSWAGGDSRGGP